MNFDNLIEEWNAAGKPGGIPDVSVVRTVAPGEDIQAAIDAVHAAGGGAVLLEEGTHRVSQSINLKSNVVLRGEDRDKTVIESTIRSNDGDSTIEMDNVTNGGVENLTLEYVVPGYTPDPHAYTNTPGGNDDNIDTGHIYLTSSTKHSWVKDVTALNAGSDPIVVDGHYNTLTGNYVEGAYMKGGGGNGYYRVRGDHNLFENETVIDIRHFAIMDTADHNVIVDSYFETDINFHSGDSGSNLVEN
ncbi:MAG: glycosyl hydrolase family 28-related protein, partial [Pseudomonadota bacterium]